MGSYDLKKSRKNIVAKDNRMIQNSRISLGLMETKAVGYLISKIKPDDEPGKIYIFNCREFQNLMRWNRDASYLKIRSMLQNIGDLSWWIEGKKNGRKKEMLVRWFNIVNMDPGTGDIEISFHEQMFPYILDLKKRQEEEGNYYTTYQLQNIMLMKHRYSPRIYEILKSYQYNNKKWTFEVGTGSDYDLQIRIADVEQDRKTGKLKALIPSSWSNWAIFKRDVLNPAKEEINKYTDIKVDYKGKKEDIHHRKTRGIRTVEFYMVGKTGKEKSDTEEIIDAEYTIVEDKDKNQLMSVEDIFFAEHEKSIKKEREYDELLKQERKIEESKHPALYESLNCDSRNANLDEREINQLYKMAINGRAVGVISYNKLELFAIDLIIYYFDQIAATPEDTKTTLYKRLLNCVKNDYDGVINELLEKYIR